MLMKLQLCCLFPVSLAVVSALLVHLQQATQQPLLYPVALPLLLLLHRNHIHTLTNLQALLYMEFNTVKRN